MAMLGKRRTALILSVALAVAYGQAAYSQQITRIAVLDLTKVISACSPSSQSVKDFEQKKSQIQTEIDKMSAEITRLMAQKVDADKAGDKAGSQKYREEVDSRRKVLTDYVSVKQVEIDADAKKLQSTDAFSQSLYKRIQDVAEASGYSLVLNLSSSDAVIKSILWNSPAIDITSDVVQALTKD
jgi:Skp family chaperone for outer membrane proteins